MITHSVIVRSRNVGCIYHFTFGGAGVSNLSKLEIVKAGKNCEITIYNSVEESNIKQRTVIHSWVNQAQEPRAPTKVCVTP